MAGPLAAPIIGAVGSLLGGLFGSSKPKYVVPNYAGIVAAAEKAGINPLTALQAAPGSVVAGENAWGSAIAQSASFLASGVEASRQATTERLQQQNNDLRKQIERSTLRPSVGGIYSSPGGGPSVRRSEVLSGRNNLPLLPAVRASSGPDDGLRGGSYRPLITQDALDPRRPVDNLPITSEGAYAIVDNPNLGREFYVPMIGGEIPEITQYPTIAGGYIASRVGQYLADNPVGIFRGPSSSGKLDDASGMFLPRSTAYGRGETSYPDTVRHFSDGSFRIVPVRRPPVSAMPGYIPRFDPFHRDGYYSGPRL